MRKTSLFFSIVTFSLLFSRIVVFAGTPDGLLSRADEMIADRLYFSAFALLADSGSSDSRVIAKKVEIAINYFAQSVMHTSFAFKDMEQGEDLDAVRMAGGEYEMFLFDPAAVIVPLLEKDPEDGVLLKALADYYYDACSRFGDDWTIPAEESLEKAYSHYTSAIEAGIDDYLVFANTAHYPLVQGNFDEARKLLVRSIELNPDYATAHYNLSYALYSTGDIPNALSEAETAAGLYEDAYHKYDALMLSGQLSYEQGETEKSAAYFNRAMELVPEAYEPPYVLMRLYLGEGEMDKAEENASRLFAMYPEDPNAMAMIVNSYAELGMLKEFVSFAESLVSRYTEDGIAGNILFYTGLAYRELGDNEAMRSSLEQAREVFVNAYGQDHPVIQDIDQLLQEDEQQIPQE